MSRLRADLRSDTVSRPTEAMRAAIAAAEVGDDVYGEDPTVAALEARVAGLLGHEAGLLVPSGTMGNQVALAALAAPGEAVLCAADSHVLLYESGGLAALRGLTTRTYDDLGAIAPLLAPVEYGLRTTAVAVEQTHMRGGGRIVPLGALRALRAATAAEGVALHCDGARLWNAHVASGVPLATYGALFDTVSVCLSKGLGAPVGSVVTGSRERIAAARRVRLLLGGQMRQAGILASAGLHALEHHVERLAEDHARARHLAEALAHHGVTDPAATETNMVLLHVGAVGADAAALVRDAREHGVGVVQVAPSTVRAVTHMDLGDDALDHAVSVLDALLAGRLPGVMGVRAMR
jgi:threonine aldolase